MSKLLIPYSKTKRTLPLNIKKEDLYIFEKELFKDISPFYLEKRRWYYISPDYQIFKNRFIIDEELSPPRTTIKGLKSKLWAFAENTIFRKNRILKGSYIYVVDNWSEGYFHWMADVLPKLYALKDSVNTKNVLLPDSYKERDFVVLTLNYIGFHAIYFGLEFVKVEKCFFLKTELTTGNYHESLMKKLRNDFLLLSPNKSNKNRKTYISRKFATKRRVQNEEELVGILEKYGFIIEYFEQKNWLDQVNIINSSSYLISLHGAGLTNMLFLKPDSKVLELRRRTDNTNNCYFSLSSALDLNYFYLECETNKEDTNQADFIVDPIGFEETVKLMLG